MKIKSIFLGTILLAVLFGGIFISSITGNWQTESVKVPAKLKDDAFAGEYNPVDIRGSYGFADISSLFEIPIDILAEAFMLPEDIKPENFYNKDLEGLYAMAVDSDQEIGNASVQLFVAMYKNLPYPLEEDVYLPQIAVDLLLINRPLMDDQVIYLEKHAIQINPALIGANAALIAGETTIPEEHVEGEAMVKGQTTFYDVLEWGVSEEQITQVIGDSMPTASQLIRDYCTQTGISFNTIKIELQELVDAAQMN